MSCQKNKYLGLNHMFVFKKISMNCWNFNITKKLFLTGLHCISCCSEFHSTDVEFKWIPWNRRRNFYDPSWRSSQKIRSFWIFILFHIYITNKFNSLFTAFCCFVNWSYFLIVDKNFSQYYFRVVLEFL